MAAYQGHSDAAVALALPPDPDPAAPLPHQFFLTASADATAHLYDFERTGPLRILATHRGGVDAVALHPSLCLAATAGEDKIVALWSLRQPRPVKLLPEAAVRFLLVLVISVTCLGFTQGEIEALVFSGDGHWLAVATEDRRLALWDIRNLSSPAAAATRQGPHTAKTGPCLFSTNSDALLFGGHDGALWSWDWERQAGEPVSLGAAPSSSLSPLSARLAAQPHPLLLVSGGCLQ